MKTRRAALALLCTVIVACGAAKEDSSPAVQSSINESRRSAIVDAIQKAAPAVVSVNVLVKERSDPFAMSFWDFFYDARRPSYRQVNSVGSGFIFDEHGHILTNYHVLEEVDYVTSVTLPDGREIEVEVVGGDERTDLAVLKAKGERLPHTDFGESAGLLIGEWVIAIGNPFGGLMGDAQPTVSVGVVSASNRRLSPTVGRGQRLYQGMIQTDAAINPGNSGGPLVNAQGEVVGVNTMIFSQSGGNVGLGFAIPIDRARRVADEIIQYGRRRDPWAGFQAEDVQALQPNLRAQLGVKATSGSLVVNILRDSPAYKAGLRPGDVITQVNGKPVRSAAEIDFDLWGMFVGDTVTLNVDRDGKSEEVRFEIVELESGG